MSDHAASERSAVLQGLISGRLNVAAASAALATFPWDVEVPLATLTPADVIWMLEHFLAGRQTAQDCRRWAEALEARDDVDHLPGHEDQLFRAIFTLATPELEGELTPDLAAEIIRSLLG